MQIVKISSKNQITLPKKLLSSLELGPNQKILIKKEQDSIVLQPLSQSIAQELAGCLNEYISPSKLGIPFNTIMQQTRKKVAKHLALKK